MTQNENGPSDPVSAAIEPRVVLVGTERAHEIRLNNPKGIADAIGPLVFGAFLKCFMGVERILAFEHLIYLNNQAGKAPGPEADEHAFARNTMVLAMMLAGTMHEIGEALQQLCDARVAVDPALRESWEPLNKLRAEWNTNRYASMIRNNFVFHLGDPAHYADGAVRADADPAILFETSGGKRYGGRYRATWDALFKAHGVRDDELRPFIDRTYEAHIALPDLVFRFFADVLRHHGVAVIFDEVERAGP